MKLADFQRAPCTCETCVLAGVSTLLQRRDPHSGAWMHGRDLRRYYEAKTRFVETFKERLKKAAM